VVVLLVLTGVISLGGKSDEDEVRSIVHRGVETFNTRDFRGAYDLLSPTEKAECSFEDYQGLMNSVLSAVDGQAIDARNIRVEVDTNEAIASYDLYVGDDFLTHSVDDVYMKEGGRWYDFDEDDSC